MIGAILGAAQVGLGLYDAYQGRKNAKRAGRLAQQEYELMREQFQKNQAIMDEEREFFNQNRAEARQRYNEMYRPLEKQIAEEIGKGVDVDQAVDQATGQFVGAYDRSLEAQRRSMSRQGLGGTSQAAAMEEDAAFNRARGEAATANQARTEATDQDFARKIAFLGSGEGLRQQASQLFTGRYDVDPRFYNIKAAESAASTQAMHQGLGAVGQAVGMLTGTNAQGQSGFQQLGGLLGLKSSQQKGSPVGDASRPNFNNVTNNINGIQTGARQSAYGNIETKKRAY